MDRVLSEKLGKTFGYCLGLATASVSYLRSSRMFHPKGELFEAEVISPAGELPPFAIARLSSGWWKNKEWPDALGIALRFSHQKINSVIPQSKDQDLLLVSFSSPWQLPVAPFITNHKDYLANEYFAVAPFEFQGKIVVFKLVPKSACSLEGSRQEKLTKSLVEGLMVFVLYKKVRPEGQWVQIAEIKFTKVLNFDQEALRFNPFQNGLNIRPIGFLQHMRIGTYRLSQWARPASGIPAVN